MLYLVSGAYLAVTLLLLAKGKFTTGFMYVTLMTDVRLPALLCFAFDEDAKLEYQQCLVTKFNVIDIAFVDENGTILCSMDISHEPYSTRKLQKTMNVKLWDMFCTFDVSRTEKDKGRPFQAMVDKLNGWAQAQHRVVQRPYHEYSYSLESLRKRGNEA